MRRRIYFMMSDIEGARQMLDEMLLARIEARHIRFLAKRDTLPPDLPQAGVLEKTDFVHGAKLGMLVGGCAGILFGGVLVLVQPFDSQGVHFDLVAMLIGGLLGALFGTWVASMVGTQVANSRLKPFYDDIEDGKTLMMVDVPRARVEAIRDLAYRRCPEVVFGGIEPSIPAFP